MTEPIPEMIEPSMSATYRGIEVPLWTFLTTTTFPVFLKRMDNLTANFTPETHDHTRRVGEGESRSRMPHRIGAIDNAFGRAPKREDGPHRIDQASVVRVPRAAIFIERERRQPERLGKGHYAAGGGSVIAVTRGTAPLPSISFSHDPSGCHLTQYLSSEVLSRPAILAPAKALDPSDPQILPA